MLTVGIGSCLKAGIDCSFAKKRLRPGPKGPRATTSLRIRRKLHDIRVQATIPPVNQSPPPDTAPASIKSIPPPYRRGPRDWCVPPQRADPQGWTSVTTGPSPLTQGDVAAYLKIYRHRMYAVWPVVDAEHLLSELAAHDDNPQISGLAYSVCAAMGAQLRLDVDYDPKYHLPGRLNTVDYFAQEAEKKRAVIDCRESLTIACILIPFFLSRYYSSKQKRFTSTLLLREALTLCELLDLDKEPSYVLLEPREARYRRKVFWLLFITERGTAMQHDLATVLRNTIELPDLEGEPDPVVFAGFLSLVRLFVAVDGTLVGGRLDHECQPFNTETLAKLQHQLRHTPATPQHNVVQRTDICITQQW